MVEVGRGRRVRLVTQKRSPYLEHLFPDLADWGYAVTSEISCEYNCVAWALDDSSRNWWPPGEPSGDVFWPEGAPVAVTLDGFVRTFERLGFVVCEDEDYEAGVEKVALFVDESGEPTHAARQKGPERWASKLGRLHDIEHPLRALEGKEYGRAVQFMKRTRG
jgi:hypothetical protein